MELAFFALLIFSIGFLVIWKRRQHKREHEFKLSEAWRIVLDDPNYVHRRRYEEKLREDEISLDKEHALLRRVEGLGEDATARGPQND